MRTSSKQRALYYESDCSATVRTVNAFCHQHQYPYSNHYARPPRKTLCCCLPVDLFTEDHIVIGTQLIEKVWTYLPGALCGTPLQQNLSNIRHTECIHPGTPRPGQAERTALCPGLAVPECSSERDHFDMELYLLYLYNTNKKLLLCVPYLAVSFLPQRTLEKAHTREK